MLPYLIHTSILLAASFIFYWTLLRKETFYQVNRYFLLLTIVLSLTIPAVHIPPSFSIHEPIGGSLDILDEQESESNTYEALNTIATTTNLKSISTDKSPKSKDATSLIDEPFKEQSNARWYDTWIPNWNLSKWLWTIYLGGFIIFSLSFLIQFSILLIKKTKLEFIQDGAFKIYELKDESSPFSFLKWIFINPTLYDHETFNQILEHEKIHVSQVHYIDKFLVELAVISFWFNPFVWLYRKVVSNNLEFLTDDIMLSKGTEREQYQMSLLKVSVPQHALDLTTNYNESFLSERIRMMGAKRSSARSSWKYLLILPLLALSMSAFNAVIPELRSTQDPLSLDQVSEPKENSNETQNIERIKPGKELIKANQLEQKSTSKSNLTKNKNNDSSQSNNLAHSEIHKKVQSIPSQMSNEIKHDNERGNVQIEMLVNHDGFELEKDDEAKISKIKSRAWQDISSKESQIISVKENELIEINPGTYRAKVKADEVCFQMRYEVNHIRNNWSRHECFAINEISNFSIGENLIFSVEREAGIVNFEGALYQDEYGRGDFSFEENDSFKDYLDDQGFDGLSENDMFLLFLNNTDKSWVQQYKSLGFEVDGDAISDLSCHEVSKNDLSEFSQIFKITKNHSGDNQTKKMINMAIHGLDLELVESIKSIDHGISVNDAVGAKIHGVKPDFVEAVREADFEFVDIEHILAMKIHGVEKDDFEAYKSAGYRMKNPNDLVNFAIHGVDPKMIDNLSDLGFGELTNKELTSFAIHGVNADYVGDIKGAGMKNVTAKNMINFAIHGVRAVDIQTLVNLGFTDITAKEMINAAIHGISTKEVQKMHQIGFEDMSMKDLVNFSIHGVDSDYIEEMHEAGFDDLSAKDLVNGIIHGIKGDYVKELQNIGVQGISFKKVKNAKIHGVTIRFIEKIRKQGYKPKYLEDYINLKIHN